jgi:hypothetical protein
MDCHSTAMSYTVVVLGDSNNKTEQHRPIRMPTRSGTPPNFREYMTGLAHLNGTVDVVFDLNVSKPEAFNGQKASFNPTLETCSAIACHGDAKPYRWPAPSKNLKALD